MHQASMCEFQIELKLGMEDQFWAVEVYLRRSISVEIHQIYNRFYTFLSKI